MLKEDYTILFSLSVWSLSFVTRFLFYMLSRVHHQRRFFLFQMVLLSSIHVKLLIAGIPTTTPCSLILLFCYHIEKNLCILISPNCVKKNGGWCSYAILYSLSRSLFGWIFKKEEEVCTRALKCDFPVLIKQWRKWFFASAIIITAKCHPLCGKIIWLPQEAHYVLSPPRLS